MLLELRWPLNLRAVQPCAGVYALPFTSWVPWANKTKSHFSPARSSQSASKVGPAQHARLAAFGDRLRAKLANGTEELILRLEENFMSDKNESYTKNGHKIDLLQKTAPGGWPAAPADPVS